MNSVRIMAILAAVAAISIVGPIMARGRNVTDDTRKIHIYKTVVDKALKLYVTTPDGTESGDKNPAIVFFHGGGWTGGQPTQFTEHSKYLASRGMVCVQVQYRLLGKNQDPPEICIADAKSAMRWIKTHAAELGIDPDRIAAGGGSAGGHLAAATATIDGSNDPADDLEVDPKPKALVLYNPVYNNGPKGWGTGRVKNRHKEFSPAHNIHKGMPPALVFFGSEDGLMKSGVCKKFRDDMRAAGSRSELIVYEGQGHGFFNHGKDNGKWFRLTVLEMDKFLESLGYLKGEPTIKLKPDDENHVRIEQ
jgi:acetyl esterase